MGKLTTIQILGTDSAMARASWKIVSSKETDEGLFTLLLQKFSDRWKIVHDHTSKAEWPK